jgi:outer membrane protein OmpA-like peptidoglycan-associated protein
MTTNYETELEEELWETGYEANLESQWEWEAAVPPGRCTPVGTRVGSFSCSDAERSQVESIVQMSVPVATLKAAVESAAGRAVSLVTKAATALDQANRTAAVQSVFCEAFGVVPEFVPPWRATLRGVVRWKDLGELVAIRLRDAAKILDGGCIRYSCWITTAHCPDCPQSAKDPGSRYACSDFHGRYVICLGGLFWKRWQEGDTVTTASTLIHEALHIYFRRRIQEQGRTGNANCYERFVVRLHNLFLHPDTAGNCAAGSCGPAPGPAPPGPPASSILNRFPFDRATVQPFHLPPIGRIADTVVASWNTRRPIRTIRLIGHADSRGSAGYNLALGQWRALAVRDRLVAAIRKMRPAILQQVRFIPQSMGERRPIAPSTTPQGRARNRRVEITLSRI